MRDVFVAVLSVLIGLFITKSASMLLLYGGRTDKPRFWLPTGLVGVVLTVLLCYLAGSTVVVLVNLFLEGGTP